MLSKTIDKQYTTIANQVAQNKTLRRITNADYNDAAKPIYDKMGVLTINNMFKFELAQLMYRHSTNSLPTPLLYIFNSNTEIHDHNTRHRRDAHITYKRTDQISRSFIHKGPEIWLTIPDELKHARTFSSFKKQMKKLILK